MSLESEVDRAAWVAIRLPVFFSKNENRLTGSVRGYAYIILRGLKGCQSRGRRRPGAGGVEVPIELVFDNGLFSFMPIGIR